MDRVGERRATRVRRAKADAKELLRDRRLHALQQLERALLLAGGEHGLPVIPMATVEAAERTRVADVANEAEEPGAARARAGRARARAAERAPAEAAAERAPEEAAAGRAPADNGRIKAKGRATENGGTPFQLSGNSV